MSRFLILLLIGIAILVSVPLGYAATTISYSFVLSITDSDGNGDNFDGATAITTDSEDRIIALDNGWRGGHDHRIAIFATDGTFLSSFLSGGDISTDDNYYDITTDSEDRIIVSDQGFDLIKIFSSAGVLTSTITDADGIGGEFDTPLGIATDSQDRIIVSDSKNSRIQIFDKNGTFLSSIGPFDDWTNGVATDSQDRIIVVEYFLHRIQIYDFQGNFVRQFGTNGDGDGEFNYPISVTTDSEDRIIVTDMNNYRIQIFDKNGNYIAQFGSLGSGDGQFASPRYITTDSQDRILVSDSHHRIQIFETPLVNTSSSSSGCNGDCTPPSLESLEVNNTLNWLTAKNQTFNIGDKQVMKFVYFEDEGIDDITDVIMGFGLPSKKSPIGTAELRLQINTFNGNFTSLEIEGNDKLFLNSTTVKVDKVQCGFFDCLEYTLEFIWAEIPFDNYFLIIASDDHRNKTYDSSQNPFTVIGETLNEQPTLEIYNRYTSTKHDGYSFDITRTDKITDMWIDEKGKEWCGLGNDRFELVN